MCASVPQWDACPLLQIPLPSGKEISVKTPAILLIVVGLAIVIWGAFGFQTRDKVLDVGPIHATKETTHTGSVAVVVVSFSFMVCRSLLSARFPRVTIHHSKAPRQQVNSSRFERNSLMSKPSGIRRNRQRDLLVLALLQQPGIEKAAAVAGISSATAWRITKTPEFKEEYRQARWDAFSQALGWLSQATGAAVSTLLKIMVDINVSAASRVRASDCILKHAASALELEDFQFRLERLEQTDKERQKEDE
jgi:hypothetical protein